MLARREHANGSNGSNGATADLDALVLLMHDVKDELNGAAAGPVVDLRPRPSQDLARRIDDAERRLAALERRMARPLPGVERQAVEAAVAKVAASVPEAIEEIVSAVAAIVPEALEHVRETVGDEVVSAGLVTRAELDRRFDDLVVAINRNTDRLADAMHRGLRELDQRSVRSMGPRR